MYRISTLTANPTAIFAAEELKKYLRMMMPRCGNIAIAPACDAKDGFRLGLMQDFGLDISDASGRLTMNIGICVWDETGIHRLTQDVRAPISASEDEITAKLSAGFAKAGLTMVDHNCSPGYYISPEHELVSQLMDVYEEHFGERPAPVAMGGGTYARKLKNAVAFGTARHGLSGPVHAPEEFVRLDFLLQDAKVMADAIIRLACK